MRLWDSVSSRQLLGRLHQQHLTLTPAPRFFLLGPDPLLPLVQLWDPLKLSPFLPSVQLWDPLELGLCLPSVRLWDSVSSKQPLGRFHQQRLTLTPALHFFLPEPGLFLPLVQLWDPLKLGRCPPLVRLGDPVLGERPLVRLHRQR